MMLSTLFLGSFLFVQAVSARELGVRILLNQGEMQEVGAGCSVKEFEVVTKALKQQAKKSDSFETADTAGRRELLNCGYICCGFPYGYCGIYQPACAGYPTYSSYMQYCTRRELNEQPDQDLIFVDDAVPEETHSLRGLQEDLEALQEVEQCRQLKKEAVIAITSVLDSIDDACADVVLLPTRLQCYVSTES